MKKEDLGIYKINGQRFRCTKYGPASDGAIVVVFFRLLGNANYGARAFAHTVRRGRSIHARKGWNCHNRYKDTEWGKQFKIDNIDAIKGLFDGLVQSR